jgi:hypothetical protein
MRSGLRFSYRALEPEETRTLDLFLEIAQDT